MLKIVKSGNVVLSSDVFTIQDKSFDPYHMMEDTPSESEDTRSQEELDQAIAMKEIIIGNAMQEAERIKAQAMEQMAIERAAMLEQIAQEAEQTRQQAFLLGIQSGACAEVNTIAECIGNLELAISKIEGEQAGFMAEFESNLKWLALEISSKILRKRIEDDDNEMVGLVKAALNSVKNTEWVRLELSEEMGTLIDTMTQELRRTSEKPIEVHGIQAPPGTCIVDTPTGKVDASVYTQLANLKEYFTQQ